MKWWLGVLGACILITVNNLLLRSIGVRPKVIFVLVPLLMGAQIGYSYAYANAPKFLYAWFLGTAAMAILGLGASYMVDRGFSLQDVVGVICIVAGAYLLVR